MTLIDFENVGKDFYSHDIKTDCFMTHMTFIFKLDS